LSLFISSSQTAKPHLPANTIGITVNGGEKMPGWFDVYDWPIGVDAKDDPKGLAMSVKRVEKV